ncbi:MAG: hypothetical protein ACYCYN_12430 [Solirubrobacteraceae bacterium]
MERSGMPSQSSCRPGHGIVVGPRVARVGIATLIELADVLDGDGTVKQIDRLRLDLDHLIDCARWAGEPLPEVQT